MSGQADEDARQDEQESGCHRRSRCRRLRVISVSCEVTFGCLCLCLCLCPCPLWLLLHLGNAHKKEGRLDKMDAWDVRQGQSPESSEDLPHPRSLSLLIHASVQIIIIITCVSVGYHRPKKQKKNQKMYENRKLPQQQRQQGTVEPRELP